ncbi:hypothetical protein FJT64_015740 [Amphibalanus amphitrite]|uniref:G-protein coupled receptors family 1 profile domain-containing protein n=1 Tax=Amphibalanus amphitrite TaxID=1232801 RepID=A0A6A4X3B3_AMPAM|nr:hypothetical protein FJT64_015740 [Amphibalanus amphitrite]
MATGPRTNSSVLWPPTVELGDLPVALFPPSWQHETFFALCGLAATLGLLSCALCSLVLMRGVHHGPLSQLLNSLVRSDALFCLPMFVRAAAAAWDDWTFGSMVCQVTSYLFESAQALRVTFILLLLLWHLVGHGWSQPAWDGVVFAAWLCPLGTGLVALLDAKVTGQAGRRVCYSHSDSLPVWHHAWFVCAVLVPTALLVPAGAAVVGWRQRRPLRRPHMLPLTAVLAAAHLALQAGALALLFVPRPDGADSGWLEGAVVPLLVTLPLLHPASDLACFLWLYPQFRPTIHKVFVNRQTSDDGAQSSRPA